MKNYKSNITQALLQLKMLLVKNTLLNSLNRDAHHPDKCQARVLKNILEKNKNTELGRLYDFTSITNIETFIKSIPIHGYEELRPYIENQIDAGNHAITPEKPVMYAQTSGTTGKPKYVPILKNTLDSYRRAQNISSYIQHKKISKIFSGKILAVVSPTIEHYSSNGTPCGSMSGLVYQSMPEILLSKYVLPPAIFEIDDYDSKYRLIAAFALKEANITCLATANPSTLIRISEIIQRHSQPLINFVGTGNLDLLGIKLSNTLRMQLADFCAPDQHRKKALELLKQDKDELRFIDIWPNLKAVVTWTSGNCALLLPKLKQQLSNTTKIVEMGYLASEFRGTIIVDCEKNLGIPTIQDNFFEFSEVESWDNGNKNTLLLSQLEAGKKYYIIATTPNGFYRYFINDIIEVTGNYYKTPTITFMQKGKGVTNLTGEKLYESQVITAVQKSSESLNITTDFFMMIANHHDFSYCLYIESTDNFDVFELAKKLNTHLCELNIEYLAKAESGRIKLANVKRLKLGTLENYKLFCLGTGQREGQFKVVKLQYRTDLQFAFEEHIEP